MTLQHPEEAGAVLIRYGHLQPYRVYVRTRSCTQTVDCPNYQPDAAGSVSVSCPGRVVLVVLTLLAYGCPIGAIVAAFGLDERTIAAWQLKAGQQARAVQETIVCNRSVDLGQVQADELYTKTQAGPLWIATAMSVFSRLWLWGVISWQRDEALITPVIEQTRAAAQPRKLLLFAVDGFKAYLTCILKVFRDPLHTGKPGVRGWWCGTICTFSKSSSSASVSAWSVSRAGWCMAAWCAPK
jgi:hypothetical protein